MKVKLLTDHLIRGLPTKEGSVVELNAGVAEDLINRKIAEKIGKKFSNKKATGK